MSEPLLSVSIGDADLGRALEAAGLPWPPTMARRGSGAQAGGSFEPLGGAVLRTLASPAAVVMVHRQDAGGVVRLTTISVSGQAVVEVVSGPSSINQLSAWPAGTALRRVAEMTDMSDPIDTGPGFRTAVEVSGSALLALLGQAGRDRRRALRILQIEGVVGPAAEAVAEAVATHTSRQQVTAVRQPAPDLLVGATVAWIGTEANSLWEIRAPKLSESGDYGADGPARVARAAVGLVPTDRTAILAELGEALGEFSGAPDEPPSLPGRGAGVTISADQRREKA